MAGNNFLLVAMCLKVRFDEFVWLIVLLPFTSIFIDTYVFNLGNTFEKSNFSGGTELGLHCNCA